MIRLSAARFGAVGAALAEAASVPALVVAELTGEGALLGRHQRALSALVPSAAAGAARRAGGGRAAWVGEGTVGVLWAEPAGGVDAPHFLNRRVRLLLRALRACGIAASYTGRDFVRAEGRSVALVSQDGGAGGALVLEALVAARRPLALPPGVSRYPERADVTPAAATLADLGARGDLAAALADAFGAAPLAEVPEAPPLALRADETELEWSGLAEIPIGFCEALARRAGDRLAAARVHGDFIAPAFAMESFERSLAGAPATRDAIVARLEEALRLPGATLLGVDHPHILVEAVLAAAG